MWIIFSIIIMALFVIDLRFQGSASTPPPLKKTLAFSAFYIGVACAFGGYIYSSLGPTPAAEYFTGYILEKALSVDNLFVISYLFTYFKIPAHLQHKVLFFGIMGALVMRGVLIALGAALVHQFSWVLDIFSVLLIVMGIKMLKSSSSEEMHESKLLIYLKNRWGADNADNTGRFFVHRKPTALFLCLISIEITDLIFALDSVPAIFNVTSDPFIIFTSNIFAILGLRSLYFLVKDMMDRFYYMNYSLAAILVFIGCKGILAHFPNIIHLTTTHTLSITVLLLMGGILASWVRTRN